MAHGSNGNGGKQILVQNSPKKHSVRFDAKDGDKHPLFSSLYMSRDGARKQLGIKDLDSASEIEVTVRVVKKGKHEIEEDEEN